jgi:hypothetical protein
MFLQQKEGMELVKILSQQSRCAKIFPVMSQKGLHSPNTYRQKRCSTPVFTKKNKSHQCFPSAKLEEIIEAYPFLNKEGLKTELTVLYEKTRILQHIKTYEDI